MNCNCGCKQGEKIDVMMLLPQASMHTYTPTSIHSTILSSITMEDPGFRWGMVLA